MSTLLLGLKASGEAWTPFLNCVTAGRTRQACSYCLVPTGAEGAPGPCPLWSGQGTRPPPAPWSPEAARHARAPGPWAQKRRCRPAPHTAEPPPPARHLSTRDVAHVPPLPLVPSLERAVSPPTTHLSHDVRISIASWLACEKVIFK